MSEKMQLIVAMVVGGLVGGVLGVIFDPLSSIWFWVFDIPAVSFIFWWFVWRTPTVRDYDECVNMMCHNPQSEENEWCDKHQLSCE